MDQLVALHNDVVVDAAVQQVEPVRKLAQHAVEAFRAGRLRYHEVERARQQRPLGYAHRLLAGQVSQFSTELRVALERDSGLSFTGGVYLFTDDDVVLVGFDDASASFQFLGFFFPIISVGVSSGGYGESDQRTRSMAVFADITFPLTDSTSFEIGASLGYLNAEYEEFEILVLGMLTDVSRMRPSGPAFGSAQRAQVMAMCWGWPFVVQVRMGVSGSA